MHPGEGLDQCHLMLECGFLLKFTRALPHLQWLAVNTHGLGEHMLSSARSSRLPVLCRNCVSAGLSCVDLGVCQ